MIQIKRNGPERISQENLWLPIVAEASQGQMKTVIFTLHWTSLVTTEQKAGSPALCPGDV